MLSRLLPFALVASGLSAQVIYDNGPFESPAGSGLSVRDFTNLGHDVLGYGGQGPGTGIDNALIDDFTVSPAAPPTAVVGVEFFCYQTNGGTVPLVTAAYVTIYSGDPNLGGLPVAGSPLLGVPLVPVQMLFTGVYRVPDTALANTQRAIWSIVVALPQAVALPPGTYWIRLQADGSPNFSGPWFPPITCPNQDVTGDAMQFIGSTGLYSDPILSGGVDPQGIPFRLIGAGFPAVGIQSLGAQAAGCGNTGIDVCGSTALGGFVRTTLTLSDPNGIGAIGYQLGVPNFQTFCGCDLAHGFPIAFGLWGTTTHVINLPYFPNLVGVFPIIIQGAELKGIGGCVAPQVNFTQAYLFGLGV